jgi:DNA-binding response OmpR family regulator
MNESPPAGHVLIVNSSPDVIDMLRHTFEAAGWSALTAHVHDAREGKVDVARMATDFGASVIVFDIAPPYAENWLFLEQLRGAPAMSGRHFVITTTNVAQLRKVCGSCEAIEIVGRPFDIDEVLKRAAALAGVRAEPLTQRR